MHQLLQGGLRAPGTAIGEIGLLGKGLIALACAIGIPCLLIYGLHRLNIRRGE